MAERPKYDNYSQTLVFNADEFNFETLEQENGRATVVRFQINNPRVQAGDILCVLSGGDVHFHGMIGRIENGYGIATDRRGSLLPAPTIQ